VVAVAVPVPSDSLTLVALNDVVALALIFGAVVIKKPPNAVIVTVDVEVAEPFTVALAVASTVELAEIETEASCTCPSL